MKILATLILSLTAMLSNPSATGGLHTFTVKDIRGRDVALSAYQGKVVLVVNTASRCGYTPQYKELQELYAKYSDRGLVILGFPANNFMGQEPGSDEEIAEFCQVNYGVTFPLFSKVSVKGNDQHPLFAHLTSAANRDFTGEIRWNFEKFLIDGNGNLVRRFRSDVKPTDAALVSAVEALLPAPRPR